MLPFTAVSMFLHPSTFLAALVYMTFCSGLSLCCPASKTSIFNLFFLKVINCETTFLPPYFLFCTILTDSRGEYQENSQYKKDTSLIEAEHSFVIFCLRNGVLNLYYFSHALLYHGLSPLLEKGAQVSLLVH